MQFLHKFFTQKNSEHVFTSKLVTCTCFHTKTQLSFLHQNSAQVFTPKPCAAFYIKTPPKLTLFTPKLCTDFYTKILHRFLHQNTAQIFTSKPWAPICTKILHRFVHQNPALLFALKPCTPFSTKFLHNFFHQNWYTCTGF